MLNKEQTEAVRMFDGHVCVVAGAGSGKTRVLTERITEMVKSGIPARDILAFTFTRKAAEEMGDRIRIGIGEVALEEAFVGTIHSLFYRVIREHLPETNPKYKQIIIIKEWQQKKIMQEIHSDFRFIQEWQEERKARSMVGRAKNMGFHVDDFIQWMDANNYSDQYIDYYAICYEEYDQRKEKESFIDFDDMLIMSRDIFASHPEILQKWQSKWRYISVDEYQDINPVQEQLIDMLHRSHGNLFVVGDARQSIYGFRSSDPSFILDFHKKYADAKIVSLFRNYRCGEAIMDRANRLIANNLEGKEPMKAETGYPGNVRVFDPFESNEEEAVAVIAELMERSIDHKYEDFAILYRCNHQSRVIEDICIRNSIPYEIIGSEGFYGRTEVKDLMAYIEVVVLGDNLVDPTPFGRIVNKPTRYLGKKFIEEWEDVRSNDGAIGVLSRHDFRSVNRRNRDRVIRFQEDLNHLIQIKDDPSAVISYVRNDMKYDYWWLDNRAANDVGDDEALANLNELQASAHNFKTCESMLNYVNDITRRYSENGKRNRVKMMSLHRAKGLEFPVVFITGMNEVLLPHRKAHDLTEERRLAYVGVTRAKNDLYMSYHSVVNDKQVNPSPFFPEMGFAVVNPENEWDEDEAVNAPTEA